MFDEDEENVYTTKLTHRGEETVVDIAVRLNREVDIKMLIGALAKLNEMRLGDMLVEALIDEGDPDLVELAIEQGLIPEGEEIE